MTVTKHAPPATSSSYKFSLNPLTHLAAFSERRQWAYLLILPSLILVAAIVIYPVISGVLISFQALRLNRPNVTGFVGLQHYAELIKDPVFQKALWNTLLWVVFGVGSQFLLGLVTALALNRPLPGMRIARVLVLLPWLLPSVVAGNMWALMLDSRLGVLNDLMIRVGLLGAGRPWFSSPDTAFPSLLVVALWQGFPFFALILLAGLQGIPEDLYEAAAVDGANRWQQFVHVTFPLLTPVTVAVVILRVIGMVNSPDLIVILTNGGPGHATETLSSYAFTTAYQSFNFGYAGALSVIMFLILMVFTVIYVRASGIMKA